MLQQLLVRCTLGRTESRVLDSCMDMLFTGASFRMGKWCKNCLLTDERLIDVWYLGKCYMGMTRTTGPTRTLGQRGKVQISRQWKTPIAWVMTAGVSCLTPGLAAMLVERTHLLRAYKIPEHVST